VAVTENLLAVYRIPNHPKAEWASGVEVKGVFNAAPPQEAAALGPAPCRAFLRKRTTIRF